MSMNDRKRNILLTTGTILFATAVGYSVIKGPADPWAGATLESKVATIPAQEPRRRYEDSFLTSYDVDATVDGAKTCLTADERSVPTRYTGAVPMPSTFLLESQAAYLGKGATIKFQTPGKNASGCYTVAN